MRDLIYDVINYSAWSWSYDTDKISIYDKNVTDYMKKDKIEIYTRMSIIRIVWVDFIACSGELMQ